MRKVLSLTQQEFADKLKISRSAVASYETRSIKPMDVVIYLICNEFNVREDWLREGKGDMFKQSGTSKSLEQLKRDSEILDLLLALLISEVDDYDRPLFEALVDFWRKGERVKSPLERLALESARNRWRMNTGSYPVEPKKEVISLVGLMMLDDVNPACARNDGMEAIIRVEEEE